MARRTTMWSFDPVRVGRAECDAWVGYYRRDWPLVLRSAVAMVREGFALPWPRTVLGAWYVLRGNQLWAPYPENDRDGARAVMRRFYALVARDQGLTIDPARAAELEVAWWHEHRVLQRERTDADESGLVRALSELYAYVYGLPEADARSRRPRPCARDADLRRLGRGRVRPGRRPAARGAAAAGRVLHALAGRRRPGGSSGPVEDPGLRQPLGEPGLEPAA